MGEASKEKGKIIFHFYGRNRISREASVRVYECFQVASGENSTAYIPRSYCFIASPHETVNDISRGATITNPGNIVPSTKKYRYRVQRRQVRSRELYETPL